MSIERTTALRLPTHTALAAIFALESIKGFGPNKFKEIDAVGRTPEEVLDAPDLLPTRGKRGAALREAIAALPQNVRLDARERAERQLALATEYNSHILTYDDPAYPRRVYASNNPVPALFVRGPVELLSQDSAVACVGSRSIREPYVSALRRISEYLAISRITHVSGFALGADTIGHTAVHEAGGKTICVMPSGLHAPFPPENRELWKEFLASERAVFVSEFSFHRRASALTLRKRNKLIVALADGLLVAQSSASGGAMNAYRFAIEQKKPVSTLQADGSSDTSGNQEIADAHRPRLAVFDPARPLDGFTEWVLRL